MLVPEVQQQLASVGTVEIVVGIPTFNNAKSIERVLEVTRTGLAKYFAGARAALVVSDAGSADRTLAIVAGVEWEIPKVIARHEAPPGERASPPFHGIPGRGRAQRTILEAARQLEARACVLVAPDCQSMTPEWIERLFKPVLDDGGDYVAPLYQRHRYEGTLTRGLIYPLVRALYGKRIRQPWHDHVSFSGRLIDHFLSQETRSDLERHGLDLWMTAVAATDGFAVAEAWLGPCVLEAQVRSNDLATIFAQTIGPAFAMLEHTADVWPGVRGSEPVQEFGAPLPLGTEPMEINVDRMVSAFRLGLKDLMPLWAQVLAPDHLAEVLALGALPDEAFRFPHQLWPRVVYDFALGHRFRILHRDHLLRSLVPLYLGRTATLIHETLQGGAIETERWLERACLAFEQEKRYLAERWQ
ncbi:MAG TPA: glycosyltransferase [Methylomirabilota bacterium]|nr:glycosyltransferase [Methylomirabilota bacterium]